MKPLLLVKSPVVVGTTMFMVVLVEASAVKVPTKDSLRWIVSVALFAAAGIVGLFIKSL